MFPSNPCPYIGITGFMSREEVRAAVLRFPDGVRDVAVGVLASAKTFANPPISVRRPNRYPAAGEIADILAWGSPDDGLEILLRVLCLVHYATDDAETLGEQLEAVCAAVGRFGGFQLNVAWPPITPRLAAVCKGRRRIVLQINRRAVEQAGGTPQGVIARLATYVASGLVTDVLFDASGGEGKEIDAEAVAPFVEAAAEAYADLGIGVAGGLCAETLPALAPLVRRFPFLSIDAEGRLRDADDRLDMQKVLAYARAVDGLFTD